MKRINKFDIIDTSITLFIHDSLVDSDYSKSEIFHIMTNYVVMKNTLINPYNFDNDHEAALKRLNPIFELLQCAAMENIDEFWEWRERIFQNNMKDFDITEVRNITNGVEIIEYYQFYPEDIWC